MAAVEENKLNAEQIKAITTKIGLQASLLASAFAELHSGTAHGWDKTATKGGVALIVDRSKETKPKKIQIFDPKTFDIKFETELFEGTAYQMSKPTFHTFDTKTGAFALQFFSAEEASAFGSKVVSMIPAAQHASPEKKGLLKRIFSFGKKEDENKAVVGTPTNFVHRHHIGFDPEKGFDTSNIPLEWKELFKAAGVTKKDLKNPETAAVIYNSVMEEMEKAGVPPAPPVPADIPAAPPVVEDFEVTTRSNRAATVAVTSSSKPAAIPQSASDDSVVGTHGRSGSAGASAANVDLNTAIQNGLKSLKKVMNVRADEPDMMDLKKINSQQRGSIVSTLRSALEKRRFVLSQEDIEEENEDEAAGSGSDSDWD